MASRTVSVCASAPGKVILFGEHAVVYGQPAIAAALQENRVWVRGTVTFDHMVRVCMPDLAIDYRVPLLEVTEKMQPALQLPPTAACVRRIHELIQSRHQNPAALLSEFDVTALTPVLYLLHVTAQTRLLSGLELCIVSHNLPVGAGLGSSAALGVAVAAVLVRIMTATTTTTTATADSNNNTNGGPPGAAELERIDHLAFASEVLLHGTPSGLDNTISLRGGMVQFTKTNDGGKANLQALHHLPQVPLLLVDTHVPKSTKALVAGVRVLHDTHPAIVQPVLRAMGAIATCFANSNSIDSQHPTDLLQLTRFNQHLLCLLGVSHDSLNGIVSVVRETSRDASGVERAVAKLTGAGGGGCAIVVLDPTLTVTARQSLQTKLERALRRLPDWNVTCFATSVGGTSHGVLYHDPTEFDAIAAAAAADVPHRRHRRRLLDRHYFWTCLCGVAAASTAVVLILAARRFKR